MLLEELGVGADEGEADEGAARDAGEDVERELERLWTVSGIPAGLSTGAVLEVVCKASASRSDASAASARE